MSWAPHSGTADFDFGIGCWNCGGPQAGKIDEMAYDELVMERDALRKVVEAAELLEGTGPRPILLAALEEWERFA